MKFWSYSTVEYFISARKLKTIVFSSFLFHLTISSAAFGYMQRQLASKEEEHLANRLKFQMCKWKLKILYT